MKSKVKPNVVRGGRAIDLGNNLFLMSGRTHAHGGIDIGKNPRTGLEVENNEVMQITPNTMRVFSAQPILNGRSPAQYVLGGANPTEVFNAQEYWKKVNGVRDDGSKAKVGKKVKINWDGIITTNDRPYDSNNIDYIYNGLVSRGLTDKRAASITGNIIEESGGNPFAVDGTGKFRGLLQWSGDRYIPSTDTNDVFGEIDRQLDYIASTATNVTDRKSWHHGGKGSGYNTAKDANAAFYNDDNDLDNIMRAYTLGYVRPAGGLKSYENRLKVAKQVYDRINGVQSPSTGKEEYAIGGEKRNGEIEPAIVTAKLPAKFRGSQSAAKRYAEGYKFGKRIAKERDKTAPYVLSAVTAPMLIDGLITAPLATIGGLGGGYVGEKIGYKIGGNTGRTIGGLVGGIIGGGVGAGVKPLATKINKIANLDTYYTGIPYDKINNKNDSNLIWSTVGKDYPRKHINDRGGGIIKKILINSKELNIPEAPKAKEGQYFGWRDLPYYFKDGKFNFSDYAKTLEGGYTKGVNSNNKLKLVIGDLLESTDNSVGRAIREGHDGLKLYDIGDGSSLTKNGVEYWSPVDELIIKNSVKHYSLPENSSKWSLLFKKMKYGGIHIKPSKRGTFTAAASKHGMGVQEFASKVLANKENYSPTMVKKANFARNASRWKHSLGGEIDNEMTRQYIITKNNIYKMGGRKKATFGFEDDVLPISETTVNGKRAWNVAGRIFEDEAAAYRFATQLSNEMVGVGGELDPAVVSAEGPVGNTEPTAPRVIRNTNNGPGIGPYPNYSNRLPGSSLDLGSPLSGSMYPSDRGNLYNPDNNSSEPRAQSSSTGVFQETLPAAVVTTTRPRTKTRVSTPTSQSIPQTSIRTPLDIQGPNLGNIQQPRVNRTTGINPIINTIGEPNRVIGPTETIVGNPLKNAPTTAPNVTPTSGLGSWINSGGADLLGLGINLTGNLVSSLINRRTINNLRAPEAPVPLRAEKLKTTYNTRPQEAVVRENVARQEQLIRDNSASSQNRIARSQAARNTGLGQYNMIAGQRENIETQLINQDRMNRQQVGNQNVGLYNNWRNQYVQFLNNRDLMNAENSVAGINNAAEAIAGQNGYIARRERRRDINTMLDRDILNLELSSIMNPNATPLTIKRQQEVLDAFFDRNPQLRRRTIKTFKNA